MSVFNFVPLLYKPFVFEFFVKCLRNVKKQSYVTLLLVFIEKQHEELLIPRPVFSRAKHISSP